MSLADLLVESNDIGHHQLRGARAHQDAHGGRIEHILVENRMMKEEDLTEAISRVTGLDRVYLDEIPASGVAMAKLKSEYCMDLPCFPVAYQEETRTLQVAMTDPTDLMLLDPIIQRAGCRVKPLVAGVTEIRRAVRRHYLGEYIAPEEVEFEPAEDEEEEFKITDMSGKTMMTSLEKLKKEHEAKKAAAASGGLPFDPPPPPVSNAAADFLAIEALGPDEVERLEKVRRNFEKSQIILGAILALLEDKGILTRAEVDKRVR